MSKRTPLERQRASGIRIIDDPRFAVQDVEFPLSLPPLSNLATRSGNFWRIRKVEKSQQQEVTMRLRAMAVRVPVPVRVTLIRVSQRKLDDDGWQASAKWIRDAVARWLFGLDHYVLDARGKPTLPRAPDGPEDGIEWSYRQQPAKRGYQALRIIIERNDG